MNSEIQLYYALESLESSRSVAVFADYHLLAAMGELLSYLKSPVPLEADPLETIPLGIFPTKLPPIIFNLPQTGPAPRDTAKPASGPARMQYASEGGAQAINRWSGVTAFDQLRFPAEGQPSPATSSLAPSWLQPTLSMPLNPGGPR